MYIRFGEIPEGECSGVYHAGELVGKEDGVSVYDAKIDDWGNVSVCLPLPINANTLDTFCNLVEYDLDRYIYRHGDTYVVKYESHVQIVEYRKQSLAEALVEMLRYLLRYDFTKQQMEF